MSMSLIVDHERGANLSRQINNIRWKDGNFFYLGSLQVADNGREVLVLCWLVRHLSDKTERKTCALRDAKMTCIKHSHAGLDEKRSRGCAQHVLITR